MHTDLPEYVYKIGAHEIRIAALADVMPPSPYSEFLAQHLPPPDGRSAFDVGTGSGILSIALALQGWENVVGSDTNPSALELASINARLNAVEGRVSYLLGDMFEPVEGRSFDAIVCNPPSLPMPRPPTGAARSFYYAGPDGRAVLDALIAQARGFLNPGGRLLFINTSLANIPKTEDLLREMNYEFQIIGSKKNQFRPLYFEFLPWFNSLAAEGRCEFEVSGHLLFETLAVFSASPRFAERGRSRNGSSSRR